ncbi:hypothetical protein [Deferribacter abyssi]|uniref:hypothetical protein n=1 Tax=Deferribacter abyssi TaxID=213806 RepID=UPI003C25E5CB
MPLWTFSEIAKQVAKLKAEETVRNFNTFVSAIGALFGEEPEYIKEQIKFLGFEERGEELDKDGLARLKMLFSN